MKLTPLEIACGWVFDVDPQAPRLAQTPLAPFEALAEAVLPAVRQTPCVVSFSGGIDSSLVLAAAVVAARSRGLPLPVPVTLRFPDVQETHENDFQEAVISHLGVSDWVRLSFHDELDLVGPIASRALQRHGLLWPPNAHFHVPIFEQARGGAAVTGYGGDHLLSRWPWRRSADVLSGRVRPGWHDLLSLTFALAPTSLRRSRAVRGVVQRPWLTPQAAEAAIDTEAGVAAARPRLWPRWLRWQIGTRRTRMAQESLHILGADRGVAAHCPLLDPVFVGALARSGGQLGFGDRGAIVSRLASGVLPASLLARATKATFADVFFGHYGKAFAACCDGRGLDDRLVCFGQLRKEWSSPQPHVLTALLLQQAWLASAAKGGAQKIEDLGRVPPVARAPKHPTGERGKLE